MVGDPVTVACSLGLPSDEQPGSPRFSDSLQAKSATSRPTPQFAQYSLDPGFWGFRGLALYVEQGKVQKSDTAHGRPWRV